MNYLQIQLKSFILSLNASGVIDLIVAIVDVSEPCICIISSFKGFQAFKFVKSMLK
jgi:hypothetical protein